MKKRAIALLYGFFIITGATGLIYQILWSRKLSIIFGHTVFAISSILSAFMGGLALGSYLLGAFSDRIEDEKSRKGLLSLLFRGAWSPHLRLYGLFELTIGIYALFTPFLIDRVGNLYILLMKTFSISMYPLSIITFLQSVFIFIIPTVCMGATLPVVIRFVVKTYGEIMEKTARLYSLNTFGAVIGSFMAGFILFPTLGLKVTLISTAMINIFIGIFTIIYDYIIALNEKKEPVSENAPQDELPQDEEKPSAEISDGEKRLHRIILLVFLISGFTSMVYEVAWSRALALSLGSSVYSFSAILTVVLFGIALGSYIISRMGPDFQKKITIHSLANVELLIGISSLLVIPLLGVLPYVFLRVFPHVKSSFVLVICANFMIIFLCLIVPTVLFGMTFPMVVAIFTRNLKNLGKSIGSVYAFNTLGNIIGSFATGFILIPIIGAENSLKMAVILNLLMAGLIYAFVPREEGKKRWDLTGFMKTGLVLILVAFTVFFRFWENSAMSMGSFIYAQKYEKMRNFKDFQRIIKGRSNNVVFYKDGISSTVSVISAQDFLSLMVNGKADASYSREGTGDMCPQWLLGLVPVSMHPAPERVCVIGFGTGMTSNAAVSCVGVREVDCVEIEPAVLQAEKFFRQANQNVTASPKLKIHIADGRNFILAEKKKYDVIISETSNPWIAGIGNLFTSDFFRIAKDRLNDDGIYCQWVHIYSMAPETTRMIINTFFNVFPCGSAWVVGQADIFLIGRKNDKPIDVDSWIKHADIQANQQYLHSSYYFSPAQLLLLRFAGVRELKPYMMNGRVNTDDKPILEFEAPFNLYSDNCEKIFKELFAYSDDSLDWLSGKSKAVMDTAEINYQGGALYRSFLFFERALLFFDKALKIEPDNYRSAIFKAEILVEMKEYLKALKVLEQTIGRFPDVPTAYIKTIGTYMEMDNTEKALNAAEAALEKFPDNNNIKGFWTLACIQNRQYSRALNIAKELAESQSHHVDFTIYLARIYYGLGDIEKARKYYEKALELEPSSSIAMESLGDILVDQKHYDLAIKSYDRVHVHGKAFEKLMLKKAVTYIKNGQIEDARNIYNLMIAINNDNVSARKALYKLDKEGPEGLLKSSSRQDDVHGDSCDCSGCNP